MTKPPPTGGLVIRYDYLWTAEESQGRLEGSKDRPCAIVATVPASKTAPLRIMVCGITHTKPVPPDEGIEMPSRVKHHLGMDDDRAWVVTSEVNIVDWDDPGIVPTSTGQWAYGSVPQALAKQIQAKALARLNLKKLAMVDRTAIEKRSAARDAGE